MCGSSTLILAPTPSDLLPLAELNQCIRALLNSSTSARLTQGRLELDRPALGSLPVHPYRYVAIKTVKVNIDYPSVIGSTITRCRTSMWVNWSSMRAIPCFRSYHQQQLVASHPRKTIQG